MLSKPKLTTESADTDPAQSRDKKLRASKRASQWNRDNPERFRKNRGSNRKYTDKWEDFLGKDRLRCSSCGYDKCIQAIEFHHRNPSEKSFMISRWIRSHACSNQNQRILLEEIDKCQILCANCHRELHYVEKLKEVNNG